MVINFIYMCSASISLIYNINATIRVADNNNELIHTVDYIYTSQRNNTYFNKPLILV